MKPTHKLLFVLCPMLVLGFIYYSSGRLHLPVWGQKPQMRKANLTTASTTATTTTTTTTVNTPDTTTTAKSKEVKPITARARPLTELETDTTAGRIVDSVYDKQGFLLQLDTKLPAELMYKYGNLSEGACKPGYAAAKMTTIYPKFVKPAPMFLDRNFKRLGKVTNYLPPFGFKTQERIIDSILMETKRYGLGDPLDSLSCRRCIIVGNGGILANKSLGSKIDTYDVVVRLNEAPVKGYSNDVGTKTTMRITYPEGAIQKPENYEKGSSLFVFSAFKPLDFKWLRHMVFKEKLRGVEGFWKSVAHAVPREPSEMRILNPYFIQEAAFQFIGLPFNNGLMGKGNIPTLGTVAITMALHNCDEVAVAGFGYDMSMPQAPLHYYETVKMSAIKELLTGVFWPQTAAPTAPVLLLLLLLTRGSERAGTTPVQLGPSQTLSDFSQRSTMEACALGLGEFKTLYLVFTGLKTRKNRTSDFFSDCKRFPRIIIFNRDDSTFRGHCRVLPSW